MEWKDTVVKFYDLKKRSLTFKGNLYDYAYISHKKSVGIITEILGESIFTIAFFPSMKNDETFVTTVNFDRSKDFIIPRYESLLKFANYIIQKEYDLEKTVDIVDRKFADTSSSSYKMHEKLAAMYKESHHQQRSEYDMILFFICDWLGLKEEIYRQ
jgi:hypothetical protein